MKRRFTDTFKKLSVIVFWMAVWHFGAVAMDNTLLLPTPGQVLTCLGGMMQTALFWKITAVSIGRILLGVVLAVLLGLLLAVVCVACPLADALVSPLIAAIQATPVASFAILVLIWVNRDYVPILICAMMVLPVVWSNVCTGIRQTDVQLLEMARVYRIPALRVLRRIYVPSVLPYFQAACASALGLGWKAGVAAEVLTVPKYAIGRMISESKLYLLTEELFAWTLAVVVLSLVLQKGMLLFLRGREDHA